MEIDKKSRRLLRLQGLSFAVLFLALVGLVGWLSTRYHHQADWTASGRNTLAEASVAVLKTLDKPLTITAFARDSETTGTRRAVADFVGRYQTHKADIVLNFVNPDLNPDKVREARVTTEGEMVIAYHGRSEHVQRLEEEEFTNTLQRLARSGTRRLAFLQGHGERKPRGEANHDLGIFGQQLESKGFSFHTINLAESPAIPYDTSMLVIASPQVNLLPNEVVVIRDFVARGGNLLWFAEPNSLYGLEPLAELLGLQRQAGTVVDPTTRMLGIGNPTFAVVADYPAHPAVEGLDSLTLFPTATSFISNAPEGWDAQPLLSTVPRSWSETGPLEGAIDYDTGKDAAGPLAIGIALSHELPAGEGMQARTQRVVVVGDGDFLSNAFLGNGANLEAGNRIVNWLSHDDAFIDIPARAAPDVTLEITPTLSMIMGFGFLLVIPGVLLGSGAYIWFTRRRR